LDSSLSFDLYACPGSSSTNITSPDSTSNKAPQVSFRVVGRVGTPFSCYISAARSSWTVKGVVPLTIIIVNEASPVRVAATKLVNDSSPLSIEVIAGFTVKALAPAPILSALRLSISAARAAATFYASPDVRFYVKGPTTEVFDALIEDKSENNALESRLGGHFRLAKYLGQVLTAS
jgi:hypothetical protein